MLGRVLAEQKKYAEAEPLLHAGYEGLKKYANTTSGWARYYLPDTLDWLVQLYDGWNKPAEAAKWRKELGSMKAAQTKAEEKPKLP